MPRPKGSKNKPKTVKATVDFAARIAEKQFVKESVTTEIASPPPPPPPKIASGEISAKEVAGGEAGTEQ